MKIVERLCALDDTLMDAAQDGYLWLYDRTGIYLGTVAVSALLAGEAVVQARKSSALELILCGLLCALLARLYVQQNSRAYAQMNAVARAFRASAVRQPYLIVMAVIVLLPPWEVSSTFHALCDVVAVGYCQIIQIRDREPKDFFQSRTLAPEGAA